MSKIPKIARQIL